MPEIRCRDCARAYAVAPRGSRAGSEALSRAALPPGAPLQLCSPLWRRTLFFGSVYGDPGWVNSLVFGCFPPRAG